MLESFIRWTINDGWKLNEFLTEHNRQKMMKINLIYRVESFVPWIQDNIVDWSRKTIYNYIKYTSIFKITIFLAPAGTAYKLSTCLKICKFRFWVPQKDPFWSQWILPMAWKPNGLNWLPGCRVPINNDNLRIPTSKGGRWPRKGCGVGESRCEGQRGASDQLAPPATLIQPAHRWLGDPPDAEGL